MRLHAVWLSCELRVDLKTWLELERGGIMMRVECVQCQQRQACPTPPEGPSLPDSYDVLLEKTSELRHAQQIVYIVERRTTQKKLNLQCLIASTSLKLSEIVANKSQQL